LQELSNASGLKSKNCDSANYSNLVFLVQTIKWEPESASNIVYPEKPDLQELLNVSGLKSQKKKNDKKSAL